MDKPPVDNVKKRGNSTGHQREVVASFVEAGIVAIDREGVDRLSVSSITREASSTRPTFYSYFGNIAGLLAEIWLSRQDVFLQRLLDPEFRLEVADANIRVETRAMLEIFTVSRRIPELNEIVLPRVKAWWSTAAQGNSYREVQNAWFAANRLGMWLTVPVEPKAITASLVEVIITALGDRPSGIPADPRFASPPPISDPVFSDTTVEGQLLDAAIRVIATSGAQAASMSRIARNAQVTTGTIYPRFLTNNDLLLKSFELAVSQVTEQNFSYVDPGGFAPDQFGIVVLAGLKQARSTWRNYRFEVYLEARYNPQLAGRLRDALNATNERVSQGLGQLPIGKGERESIAFLIHTIGIGMAILLNNGVPVDTMDHALATREMVAVLAAR